MAIEAYDPTLELEVRGNIFYDGGVQKLYDSSGKARHGTPSGFAGDDSEYENANYGQCINISTPKYVGHGSTLDYTMQDFSFEMMFHANALTTNPYLLSKGTDSVNGYYLQIAGNTRLAFATSQAGAIQYTQTATGTISALIWYHAIVSRAGASIRIFLNGKEPAYFGVGVHINPITTADAFAVGSYLPNLALNLNGRIHQYRSWSRALSASDASERYAAWVGSRL